MFTMFCVFVIFLIIRHRFGLSFIAMALAMLFGAIVGIFLGPAGAIAGTLLWAVIASGKENSEQ